MRAVRQGAGRPVVLLADCLGTVDDGALFREGTEGLFLLRLAALLASGWGGRGMWTRW